MQCSVCFLREPAKCGNVERAINPRKMECLWVRSPLRLVILSFQTMEISSGSQKYWDRENPEFPEESPWSTQSFTSEETEAEGD